MKRVTMKNYRSGLLVLVVLLPVNALANELSRASQTHLPVPITPTLDDDYALAAQLQGIARPKREALLRFPTIGQVIRIHAVEGSVAQAGDPLITLDDRVLVAEVNAARVAAESDANVAHAEVVARRALRALQRVQQAKAIDASSPFEVEAKQIDYDEALALLEQQKDLRKNLDSQLHLAIARQSQMTLTAPFTGQVVLVSVKEGNSVDTATTVVQIADLSLLDVEMHLPSQLFGSVSVGEVKHLRAGMPVNRTLAATVRYVSPVIEPTGGTFLVRLEIDNSAGELPTGFEVWYR